MTTHNKNDITHQQLFLMFDELNGKVDNLGRQNRNLTEGFNRLENKIDKVYDTVVGMAGTLKVEHDERIFARAKVDRHEVRLDELEMALAVKSTGVGIN